MAKFFKGGTAIATQEKKYKNVMKKFSGMEIFFLLND